MRAGNDESKEEKGRRERDEGRPKRDDSQWERYDMINTTTLKSFENQMKKKTLKEVKVPDEGKKRYEDRWDNVRWHIKINQK